MATPQDVEETPDGRHIVVNGRRWRRSDPGIPPRFEKELVAALMQGRRGVRTDPATARPQVHDAKVALGERGQAWWEDPEPEQQRQRIAATIRTLLRYRDGTICPSDVARTLGGDHWRDLMAVVRDVAHALADDDVVVVLRRGERIQREEGQGPVRIGRGSNFPPRLR